MVVCQEINMEYIIGIHRHYTRFINERAGQSRYLWQKIIHEVVQRCIQVWGMILFYHHVF